MNWLALGKVLWGLVEPIIGPIAAYFKGRSDAKLRERLKANERDNKAIDTARRAGDAAAGKLHDKHFRD